MNKLRLIDFTYIVTTIAFTILTIVLEGGIDLIPKFPLHPIFSVVAMIYVLVLMIIGFIKILDKLIDIFSTLRSKFV